MAEEVRLLKCWKSCVVVAGSVIPSVVYQKSPWGTNIVGTEGVDNRSTVDQFFERIEKKSDHGKKLVSWHGELVLSTTSFLSC